MSNYSPKYSMSTRKKKSQLSNFPLLLLRLCFYKHVPSLPPWKMQKGNAENKPAGASSKGIQSHTGCGVGTDASSIAIFLNYQNTIRFFFVSLNALSLLPGYMARRVISLRENGILKKKMTFCFNPVPRALWQIPFVQFCVSQSPHPTQHGLLQFPFASSIWE